LQNATKQTNSFCDRELITQYFPDVPEDEPTTDDAPATDEEVKVAEAEPPKAD
jgi:hypothetical protein